MADLSHLFQDDSGHHAYLLIGHLPAVLLTVQKGLENALGGPTTGNADIYFQTFGTFGIEQSRFLRFKQQQRSFADRRRYFVLGIRSITREAQSALLKVLEEPNGKSCFVLVAGREELFLPTVRSRCEIIDCNDLADPFAVGSEAGALSRQFMAADPAGRLDLIAELLKDKEEVSRSVNELLDGLENIIYRQATAGELLAGQAPVLDRIINARRLLHQQGSLPRIILEDIALAL